MPPLLAVTILGVVIVSTLAACGSPPPPAPAPVAAVPLDGTYGGMMQLSRGDAVNCGNENPITLQVTNQAFTYQLAQPQAEWKPVIVFSASIRPDGSFDARSGPDSISGRVAGGNMQGAIVGDICGFSFSADRGGI